MDPIQLRYFVLCRDIDADDNGFAIFKGVYDAFADFKYPLKTDIKAVFGVCGMMKDTNYDVKIDVSLDGKQIGEWTFDSTVIARNDVVVNYLVDTPDFLIPQPGRLTFDVSVNDVPISRQIVTAILREEEQNVSNNAAHG